MFLLCHREDAPLLQAAFRGQFERCALSEPENKVLSMRCLREGASPLFYDFFPPPPYSYLLTQPEELHVSPYETLVTALSAVPLSALGFCQVLFQPVRLEHNWHRNVQALLDLEYTLQLLSGSPFPSPYPQQEPAYALTQKAKEVVAKAHSDKPFFAAALRIGITGSGAEAENLLSSLLPFSRSFLHGGRHLCRLSEQDYREILSPNQIPEMFVLGQTYRPGFLLNSSELCGLVHVPPASVLKHRQLPVDLLDTLPVRSEALSGGLLLGFSNCAGVLRPVCIPEELRTRSAHYLGRPDMGKSSLIRLNASQDICEGRGIVVLDPHGDLVEKLLRLIPEKHVQRTIYFNPADPDYVPLWNPLKTSGVQRLGRMADDLVASIKGLVDGWGDRLENILRYAFLGLLPIQDATLQDVADLLRRKSSDSELLRRRVLEITDNDSVRKFWKEDFDGYQRSEFHPPQHKLSKLLASSDTCAEMLSQPQSLIDFRDIMDEGKVLLVNLSGLGSETRGTLGSLMLSGFHVTALCRSAISPATRKPFHIYCDEAHRFTTGALEDLLMETRKYGIGLTLAHQYLSQFETGKKDALASVGTTAIFGVDTKDASYLKKDLQDKVRVSDLISLEEGEVIARIGTEIVRFKTPRPREIPRKHFRDRIIAESRRRYYRPIGEVRAAKRQRDRRWEKPFTPLTEGSEEEFHYEEL